jgi:hypothetical protein
MTLDMPPEKVAAHFYDEYSLNLEPKKVKGHKPNLTKRAKKECGMHRG